MDVELLPDARPGGGANAALVEWMKSTAGTPEVELVRLRRRLDRAERQARTARALALIVLVIGLGVATGVTLQSIQRPVMALSRAETAAAPVSVIERPSSQQAGRAAQTGVLSEPAGPIRSRWTRRFAGLHLGKSKTIPPLPPAAFGRRTSSISSGQIAALPDAPRPRSAPLAVKSVLRPSSPRPRLRHARSSRLRSHHRQTRGHRLRHSRTRRHSSSRNRYSRSTHRHHHFRRRGHRRHHRHRQASMPEDPAAFAIRAISML